MRQIVTTVFITVARNDRGSEPRIKNPKAEPHTTIANSFCPSGSLLDTYLSIYL